MHTLLCLFLVGDGGMPHSHDFVPEPSPELSYVLGVLDGDGYVRIKGRHHLVGLQAIDYEFVDKFNKCLARIFGKHKPYSIYAEKQTPPRKTIYRVEGVCKKFVKWYLDASKETKWTLAKHYPIQYLRGIYDSEGSVIVQEIYSSNAPVLDCRIVLYNSDLTLLLFVQDLLREQGYSSKLYKVYDNVGYAKFPNGFFPRKSAEYALAIMKIKDIMRFADEIGFTIRRKQRRLQCYVSLYKTYGMGIRAIVEWRGMEV